MSRFSTMAMAFLLVLIVAVGSLASASGAESGVAADGGGWTLQASPNPAGSDNTMLASVSCMSAVTCMAVGYSSGKHGLLTLAELLRKTTWTIEKTPDAAKDNYLTGVSCSGPAWCTAVGTSFTPDAVQAPLVEAWNGKTWLIQSTPSAGPNTTAGLESVSCNRPDSCTAVGAFSKSGPNAEERPLAEHWNGSKWTIQATPNPHAENGSQLDGVSCTATDACTAGGNYAFADIDQSIFALRWDGTQWSMQKQPNPEGQGDNTDSSVSCANAVACASVGTWVNGADAVAMLAESWDGTTWVRDRTQNPAGAKSTVLNGVACASVSRCMAVGGWTKYSSIPAYSLSESWNGSVWTLQATPNPSGSMISTLHGVACASANDCVAVGSYWNGSITQTLAEAYSG